MPDPRRPVGRRPARTGRTRGSIALVQASQIDQLDVRARIRDTGEPLLEATTAQQQQFADLMRDGLLTEQEFAAKKADLLERMRPSPFLGSAAASRAMIRRASRQ